MADEPKNADEAMAIVLRWIENGADLEKYKLDGACLPTFREKNLGAFKSAFENGKWKYSKGTLQIVAGIHGTLSAHVARLLGASDGKVPFEIFYEVGVKIRKHCPPTDADAELRARSGDWCQWP